jgi:hypothetical protein
MALLSIKEFGESMGMSYDTTKKNVSRGNIIKGTDGKIDTENAVNKLYFDNQIALGGTKNAKTPAKKIDKRDEKKTLSEKPRLLTKDQQVLLDIELRKKRADVDLVERSSELKRIQLEKQAGNLLPLDLVEKCLVINIQSIIKGFKTERDNMSRIVVEKFGGTRKDLVEVNLELDKILDMVVKKAKKEASYELENAINTYK